MERAANTYKVKTTELGKVRLEQRPLPVVWAKPCWLHMVRKNGTPEKPKSQIDWAAETNSDDWTIQAALASHPTTLNEHKRKTQKLMISGASDFDGRHNQFAKRCADHLAPQIRTLRIATRPKLQFTLVISIQLN